LERKDTNMSNHIRVHTDTDSQRSIPEVRLWCAVLKRAIDDVLYFKPDSPHYHYAVDWLTSPSDENKEGSLANVVANVTNSPDLQETVIKRLREIVFCKKKLRQYRQACITTSLHRLVGRTAGDYRNQCPIRHPHKKG